MSRLKQLRHDCLWTRLSSSGFFPSACADFLLTKASHSLCYFQKHRHGKLMTSRPAGMKLKCVDNGFACCCRSWCDRYGDVVLEVVHKEFKDHVGEMENQRKAGKLKRAASKAAKEKELAAFSKNENDENSGHPNISNVLLQSPKTGAAFVKRSPKTSLNQCFTTTGATLVESKAKLPLIEEQPEGDVVRNCRGLGFDKELDGKLTAEILRMPSKRFNDVSALR